MKEDEADLSAKREQDLRETFEAVGRAMAQWAIIERGLGIAFSQALKADLHPCQRVFSAPTSFGAKNSLLKAAIEAGVERWPEDLVYCDRMKFYLDCANKAGQWSSVRNRLAHGEATILIERGDYLGGVVSPLRTDRKYSDNIVTLKAVIDSAEYFRRLGILIMKCSFSDSVHDMNDLRSSFKELPKEPFQTRQD